ncbi:MAG: hypothetical protein GQE15_02190 [Archangiaceae bacterium]|nr:hypothetical protein [Archangiaceae bacterium]
MPPRSTNLALQQQPELRPPTAFDFAGRRLKVVKSTVIAVEEPSPMLEAIRRYLDSLP